MNLHYDKFNIKYKNELITIDIQINKNNNNVSIYILNEPLKEHLNHIFKYLRKYDASDIYIKKQNNDLITFSDYRKLLNKSAIKTNDSDEHIHKKHKFDEYLSATATKYFQHNDNSECLLNMLNINTVEELIKFIINNKYYSNSSQKNINYIQQFIFNKGNDFEQIIINNIKNNATLNGLSFIQIMNDPKPFSEKYNIYLDSTKQAISNKIDIIYQGMLQTSQTNSPSKYRGFPDLMISKKAFKLLFNNYYSRDNSTEFIDFHTDHYIIIDIKSSNIHLNIDGITCRNTDLLKLYKSQLAVYGYIYGENYNTNNVMTYILPNSVKLESKAKNKFNISYNNLLNLNNKLYVCSVDLLNRDYEYKYKLDDIYNNYLFCLTEYKNLINNKDLSIKFLYDEQIDELKKYDNDELIDIINCKKLLILNENMIEKQYIYTNHHVRGSAKMNDKYNLNMFLARHTKSLSLVRGFDDKLLNELKKNKIVSYIQTDKILNSIENKSIREKHILQTIIRANDPTNNLPIYCENKYNVKKTFDSTIMNNNILFCLDFETIPNKLISNIYNSKLHFDYQPDQNYENFGGGQSVFMIGCNIYKNNKNIFNLVENSQFVLTNINSHSELLSSIDKLFTDLKKYIIDYLMINKINKNNAVFVIWSQFEINVMKEIGLLDYELCYEEKEQSLYGIRIIDLYKIFIDSQIGIKGAFDYSIKSVASGLQSTNSLILTNNYWNSKITHGLDALYYGLFYYYNIKNNINDEFINNRFREICVYNDIDCSIMCDIINSVYKLLINTNK